MKQKISKIRSLTQMSVATCISLGAIISPAFAGPMVYTLASTINRSGQSSSVNRNYAYCM